MQWKVSPTCHPEPEEGEPGQELSSAHISPLPWADPFHLLINTMSTLTLPQKHFDLHPTPLELLLGSHPPDLGLSDPHTLSPCRAREAPPVQERRLHEPALQGEVAVQ